MKQAKIYNLKDNKVYADPCLIAESVWTRFMGLMGKPYLDKGTGLLIEPCNSIHTFFMRFPIDVVYLGKESAFYKVLRIARDTRPWRMHFPVFGAAAVLEMPSGGAQGLSEGDILCLS